MCKTAARLCKLRREMFNIYIYLCVYRTEMFTYSGSCHCRQARNDKKKQKRMLIKKREDFFHIHIQQKKTSEHEGKKDRKEERRE